MNDIEKGGVYPDKDQSTTPDYSSGRGEPSYEAVTHIQHGIGRRFVDSFRRDPTLTTTPPGVVGANGRVFNPELAAAATANSPLARRLKGRHLQMIAIGGSIGQTPDLQPSMHSTDFVNRYWTFRCIRQISRDRRTCIADHMLYTDWAYAVLYGKHLNCPTTTRSSIANKSSRCTRSVKWRSFFQCPALSLHTRLDFLTRRGVLRWDG
jgi:hypothetical protein